MDKEWAGWSQSESSGQWLDSKEKAVMSGIHQGLVLGTALFNIFAGDMNSRIESTLSKFTESQNGWKVSLPTAGKLELDDF